MERLLEASRARRILAGEQSWASRVDALPGTLMPGRSVVPTDSPSRAAETHNHMPEAFRALLLSAQSEVLITDAYIIPAAVFVADLQMLAARGVKARILTNSLASHDVPAVNSHCGGCPLAGA